MKKNEVCTTEYYYDEAYGGPGINMKAKSWDDLEEGLLRALKYLHDMRKDNQ